MEFDRSSKITDIALIIFLNTQKKLCPFNYFIYIGFMSYVSSKEATQFFNVSS